MLNKQPGSFFDKNTLTAIVLSFAVFFVWQTYVAKKYPQKTTEAVEITQMASPIAPGTAQSASTGAAMKPDPTPTPSTSAQPEETLKFTSPQVEFEISSVGMGLKNLKLPQFTDRRNEVIVYNSSSTMPIAATTVNGLQNFRLTKISDNQFEGVASGNNLTVKKTITVNPEKYSISIKVETQSTEKQKITADTYLNGKVEAVSKNFLLPSYEHQEFFVISDDKEERNTLSPDTPLKHSYANVKLASFNSHYFALVLANRTTDVFPTSTVEMGAGQIGTVDLKYETAEPVDAKAFNFDFYFGPKQMDVLKSLDEDHKEIINYGFFSFISRPLLWLLKNIQDLIHNWGVAIIVLTLLLRLLLLPMNWYSYKAMKKMQKIQPILKDIKERYKNDPQRVNVETMALMKREKANPLSGCLPALAQIPIFFAFYSVLGQSIELYKQPFFFWINDLSLKDPFYVLPVLVGATFFVQQKLTPTTSLDPAQQKVMMFMPLLFVALMFSTPSGLTLYMFFSGVFGIVQQIIFNKKGERFPTPVVPISR